MKKFIWIAAAIAVLLLGAWKLHSNQEEIKAEASLSEKVSAAIPVELGTAAMEKLKDPFTASGILVAAVDISIVSETQGVITRLPHKRGDFVHSGDLLAQVENGAQQANVLAMRSQLDQANNDLERAHNLRAGNAMTQQQVEQAEFTASNAEAQLKTAQDALRKTTITAPVSGYLNDDDVQLGSYINAGTKLYQLVDIGTLKLDVMVPESRVLEMVPGKQVHVALKVLPGTRFSGTVASVSRKADATLKYSTEIVLKNEKDSPLRAGMYAEASFPEHTDSAYLVVDRNALVGSILEPKVYVVKDSIARLRPVTVGRIVWGRMVVKHGLKAGEEVVVNGQINLVDSTRIRAITH